MKRSGALAMALALAAGSCRPRAAPSSIVSSAPAPVAPSTRPRVRGDLDGDGYADAAFSLAPVGFRVRFGGPGPAREQSYPAGFAPVLGSAAPAARVREALRGVRRERLVGATTAGDFDGDGRAELAFSTRDLDAPVDPSWAHCAGNTVRVASVSGRELAFDRAPTVAPPHDAAARFGAYALALPDEDGDGDDELVVLASETETATGFGREPDGRAIEMTLRQCSATVALVYPGGRGGLASEPARRVRISAVLSPGDAALGDLDGDGAADLALLTGNLEVYSLRASEGAGSAPRRPFSTIASAAAGVVATSISVGDVNCDGRPDVLVGARLLERPEPGGPRAVFGYVLGPLAGAEMPRIRWVSVTRPGDDGVLAQHGALFVGDLDGDRCEELAVGAPGLNRVLLFRTTREGPEGSPWREVSAPEGPRRFATSLARVGDFDGDGRDDLLAGQPDERSFATQEGSAGSSVFLLRNLASAPALEPLARAPVGGLGHTIGGLEARGPDVPPPTAPRVCAPPADLRPLVHVSIASASPRIGARNTVFVHAAEALDAQRGPIERCAREAYERDCDHNGVALYDGRLEMNGPRAAAATFTNTGATASGALDDELTDCLDRALQGLTFARVAAPVAATLRVDLGALAR